MHADNTQLLPILVGVDGVGTSAFANATANQEMTMRIRIALASAGLLLVAGTAAWAAPPSFETPVTPLMASPPMSAEVATPEGTGIVTGSLGSMGTVTLPGVAGEGLLMNNGNGTSTLLVPNGPPDVVPTPR